MIFAPAILRKDFPLQASAAALYSDFDLATQFMIRSIAASGIVALLLASSAPAGAEARLTEYVSRVWQTENGLPQNAVQAIVQTRDGYLWLGTPAGLVRFDGVRFTVFN